MKLKDVQFLIQPFEKVTIFFEKEHQEDYWDGYWKDCPYMNKEILLIWAISNELNFSVKGRRYI